MASSMLTARHPTVAVQTPPLYEAIEQTGEIRTLQVLSSSTPDDIRCTLSKAPLTSSYTCLSYVWGSEAPTNTVTVNNYQVLVRNSLHVFLQTVISQPDRGCLEISLWIDAICINQDDVAEKNQQVSQMGDIFAQAKKVRVWLGSGDKAVQRAIESIRESYSSHHSNGQTYCRLTESECKVPQSEARVVWDTFDILNSLPYWRRVWIIQELLLAKEVELWYGSNETMPLKMLYHYLTALEESPGPENTSTSIGSFKVMGSDSGWLVRRCFMTVPMFLHTLQFHTAFAQLEKYLCYDSRDYIYALRSVDKSLQQIPVDYGESPIYLLPKVYGSSVLLEPHSTLGLVIIQRLKLDIDEVIKMTRHALPSRTWFADVASAGIISVRNEPEHRKGPFWQLWSRWKTRQRRVMGQAIKGEAVTVAWGPSEEWMHDNINRVHDGRETIEFSSQPIGGEESFSFRQGDLMIVLRYMRIALIYRGRPSLLPRKPITPDLLTTFLFPKTKKLLAEHYFVTALMLKPEGGSCVVGSRILSVEKCMLNELLRELHSTRLTSPGGSHINVQLTWPCLLRLWEAMQKGAIPYESPDAEVIGSWEEEERKAQASVPSR